MTARIQIPAQAAAVLARLRAAGFAAYAVGGCVRDSLLGQDPKDWDICTAARPEEAERCFADCRTVLTGVRYGTVTVLWEGEAFEITTFRAENGYSDARHPDGVTFLNDLRGDLARRDFTINAMAADADGTVVDPFGGQKDLENGILRCVGQPEQRFSEDALRILRGLRFAARLDLQVEDKTARAMHALRQRLSLVAPERLHKELDGLLCGAAAARLLREFQDVLWELIPELRDEDGFRQYNYHHAWTVWEHTLAALTAVEPEPILRLTLLLHDIGKPAAFTMDKQLQGHFYGHAVIGGALAERILRRLRYDNETVKAVSELVRRHDCDLIPPTEKRMRRLLAAYGEEQTRRLLRVRRADRLGKGTEDAAQLEAFIAEAEACLDAVLASKACVTRKQLAVNGTDLLALGIPQGPELGAILDQLFAEVVAGDLQNYTSFLVQRAQEIRKQE